jgi:hypothetical protein
MAAMREEEPEANLSGELVLRIHQRRRLLVLREAKTRLITEDR